MSLIFKYYSFEGWGFENLESNTFYFNNPLNVNDPYDGKFIFDESGLSEKNIKSYLERRHPGIKYNKPIDISKIKDTLHDTVENQSVKFCEENGICCFTAKNDNILMWSHYSSKHTGFCVGFDRTNEVFEELLKVKYDEKIPTINIDFLEEPDMINNQYIKALATKAINWEYESEYRLIHKKAGTSYKYKPHIVKEIYMGASIGKEDEEKLKNFIKL